MSIEDSAVYEEVADVDDIALTTYSQYEYEGFSLDTSIGYEDLGIFEVYYYAHIAGDPLESYDTYVTANTMNLRIIPDVYTCGFNIPDACA
jgi:hypothetical protein